MSSQPSGGTDVEMEIRRALPGNLEQTASLLRAAELPPIPGGFPLHNVLVCLQSDSVIGVVALEVCGLRGLVRSLAVDPSHSGQGVGTSLLDSLMARAHELSLRELYLLTENSQEFFASSGFVPVSRESVPQAIRSTREYREQCPETATVMRLELATRCM
jgi:amino-acid N-acetyltransferase